jgi:superfamily II DNA or RNA helicase/very-short-patch-repair endonuclease
MNNHSPPNEKIALFRQLFRGREDVYPQRFESRKTGRAGYSPACGNEWVKALCGKPRIKCSACSCQAWLPVTDDVVRRHLAGEIVLGVYPMRRDETCFFLAADFDGEHWRTDAVAFRETCHRSGVPAALERSRSGNGAHVWLFFQEAVSAVLARKLGAFLLTETLAKRPEIGLRSYDRFFPNQDTLPKGGFGNLIALPLQKQARELGNSVFLDDTLEPLADQWAFLYSLERISPGRAETLVACAEKRGDVLNVRSVSEDDTIPWKLSPSRKPLATPLTDPIPDRVTAVLADQIYFGTDTIPASLRNELVRLAAFQNPEFYRAQAMRLPVFGKPRVISCAEFFSEHFALPRGCLDEAKDLLRRHGAKLIVKDERTVGRPLEANFRGTLRDDQHHAAETLIKHDTGVLAATTAFGKTVLAAWLIARRKTNTLVLVHRQQLMEQWVDRLSEFLDLPPKSVGRLGGGRKTLGGLLDVALIQSLVRKGTVDDRVADYGHLIVDECHHLAAFSFEQVARRAKARFVTGLSATVARKDGHHPIIFLQCGPVRHRVDAKRQAVLRPFSHRVFVRPTGFRSKVEPDNDLRLAFQNLVAELTTDDTRNRLICADVQAALSEMRNPLVLTERTAHLDTLAEHLRPCGVPVISLRGGMGKRSLREALNGLREGPRVVLATGRFVGEGFDDPQLDTLFLVLPVSWRGTIAQYAGRLHRLHDGKREARIYDYADLDVPMLSRIFDRRCRSYEDIGYEILLPASAVPGWPVDVPLPVDPLWKQNYAGSVRRLIRDGVTAPLADLFLHTTQSFPHDATGLARARSASEAFLFRRLETLPETCGRFRLNAELPIPFDAKGTMEVDFLDADARLVIELDGSQHLSDAAAYRRDRRKDCLLQRHGYTILRFLAEDAAKHLDDILDTVLVARPLDPLPNDSKERSKIFPSNKLNGTLQAEREATG